MAVATTATRSARRRSFGSMTSADPDIPWEWVIRRQTLRACSNIRSLPHLSPEWNGTIEFPAKRTAILEWDRRKRPPRADQCRTDWMCRGFGRDEKYNAQEKFPE